MDTNQTIQAGVEATQASTDMALLVAIAAVVLFLVGIVMGIMMARPSIPRARIRLRALQAYLEHDDCSDPLVVSLVNLDIRRLQERLGIDKDQD